MGKDLIHKSKEPHDLPCKLSDNRKAEAAELLANAIQQIHTLELDRKAVMKEFASRKEALFKLIHNLSIQVKDGIEIKSIECEPQLNYSNLKAVLTRLDTGEIVEERAMTDEEKQQKFV